MVRKRPWFALALIAAVLALAAPVQATHSVPQVALGGQPAALYPPPQVIDGVVLLPVRSLAEVLGAAVAWDGASATVTVSRGGHSAAVAMGSAVATVDGRPVPLQAPARLLGSRGYVPLDFLTAALGFSATWDSARQTVRVSGITPLPPAPPHAAGSTPAERAASYFNSIRTPADMDRFLRALPKGGDLHNHLSGAVFAESYVTYALQDGLCLDLSSYTATGCGAGLTPFSTLVTDPTAYARILAAWSMRDFTPGQFAATGHDQFFATFGRFGAVADNHYGEMLAEVASTAAAQHLRYLELMLTVDRGAAADLGTRVGWDDDLARLREKLLQAGMDQVVAGARANLDRWEQAMRARLHCDDPPHADPGCAVTIRYLNQATRTKKPEAVFAQLLAGMEMQQADPRVVGQQLVAPEDDPRSLQSYDQQMAMLGYLHGVYPAAHVSLHAGELTPALPGVTARDLCCHIRQAVEVAHAQRIGHGVDVLGENDPEGLLAELARESVLVEINLTSNDQILQVRGWEHPFPVYLAHGVPLALATDDAGILRIDLTHEYERAAETYGLTYEQIKWLDRNSLAYSFLPGASLWLPGTTRVTPACAGDTLGAAQPSAACAAFLAGSEKARAQWQLEADLAAFEAQF